MNMKTDNLNWSITATVTWVIISLTFTIKGQELKWSAPYEMSSLFNSIEIIEAKEGPLIIAYKYKDEKYYWQQKLRYYDPNSKQKEKGEIPEIQHEGKHCKYLSGFTIGEITYLNYSIYNKEEEKTSYLIRALSTKPGSKEGILKKIFEISHKDKFKHSGIRICQSEDRSKLLYYYILPYLKGEKARIGLRMYNNNLELISEGTATMQIKSSKVSLKDITDVVTDNDGNNCLLLKQYKGKVKKEEKKKGTRYIYSLIKMDKRSKVSITDSLKVLSSKDSAIIISAKLSVNNKTNLISCTGNFKTRTKGTALFSYYPYADTEKKAIISYPASIITSSFASRKQKNRKKKFGLEHYKIKNIFEQHSGDKIIIAEQHYIKVYEDKSEGRQELHFAYNTIIIRLSMSDTITWVSRINKRQTGGGNGYTDIPWKLYSCFAYQEDEEIHVLYNETEQNIKETDEQKLAISDYNLPEKCVLVHYTIKLKTGESTKTVSPFGDNDNKTAIIPKATKVLSDKSIFFTGIQFGRNNQEKPKYILGRYKKNIN